MRREQTLVTLRVGGQFGVSKGILTLSRYPLPHFLRFVIIGDDWKTLDALDQLSDTPKPAERVMLAVKNAKTEGSMHLSRIPRSKSGWYRTITYDMLLEEQHPPQQTLRSTELWQAWCLEQVSKIEFVERRKAVQGE